MPNRLRIIRAPILSLVCNPANKKWWYVTKEANVENLIERLETLFPAPEGFEDGAKEDGDLEEAVENAVETMEKWADELPDETKEATGVLLRTNILSSEESEDSEEEEEVDETKSAVNRLVEVLDRLEETLSNTGKQEDGEEDEEEEEESEEEEEEPEEEEEEEQKNEDEEDEEGGLDISEEDGQLIAQTFAKMVKTKLQTGGEE